MKLMLFSILFLQSLPTWAAPLCIHNFAEHQAHKNELPAFIRSLPMVLVKDGALVKAAVIVRKNASGRLTMEGSSTKDPIGSDGDPVYIKEACFETDSQDVTRMTLKFENSVTVSGSGPARSDREIPSDKVVTSNGDKIKVGMFTLELSTVDRYNEIVTALKKSVRATVDTPGQK